MKTPQEVVQDPEFLNLPAEEKKKVLQHLDPDFAGLPAAEQDSVISVLHTGGSPQQNAVATPEGQPGAIRSTLNESGLTTPEAGTLRATAQVVTAPMRGMRALGVGAERLMGEMSPGSLAFPATLNNPQAIGQNAAENAPEALGRAVEATKPGFEAQPGERVGAAIGEALGLSPLAFAVMGPTQAMGIAYRVLSEASASAALSAVSQAAERGDVEVSDVSLAAGLGGVFPLIRFAPKFFGKFFQSTGELAMSSGSTLSREAMGELATDPALLEKHAGTAQAINGRIEQTQIALKNHLTRIGERLQRARAAFGIAAPIDAIETAAEKGIPERTPQQMAQEFQNLRRGWDLEHEMDPIRAAITPPDLPAGTKIRSIPAKERLQRLYALRHDADQFGAAKFKVGQRLQGVQSSDSEDVLVRDLRGQINPLIERTGESVPGSSILRLTDKAYSQARGMYDELLISMSDEEKAQKLGMAIYKQGNPEEIIGLKSNAVDALRRLEQKTGQKFIEPLRKELAAREFNTLRGRRMGTLGSAVTAPLGVTAESLNAAKGGSVPEIMNFLYQRGSVLKALADKAAQTITSPPGQALLTSLAARMGQQQ